ncbi:TonB-dependent receptor domain-containing protein [Pedobacter nutrimenti]|uniref:TonB-dependent receptor domain-containing protein n=1 Tax=Pedobacter nutrimenti TaxID=1241337 RepID=UPI00292DE352|nr:TonB-dependent receptor [Pedobacter nutrimenti]
MQKKQLMRIFLTYLLLSVLLCPFIAQAQTEAKATGTLTDLASKQPLEFVNIILKNTKDNKVVAHEVTDKKGKFILANIPFGTYYILCTYIGYSDTKSNMFILGATHLTADLNLQMNGSGKQLNEVEISSKKALFSNAIDRKIYHVDMDLTAKSGSASEVLQNVPLVQVDIDGNVSLRNSSAMILINGKVSPLMSGSNAAAALQQLPANSIERIEVITNPSAKYKPDGTGGIINIVLKKNTKRGLNGNVTVNAGNRERYNASTALNYNTGSLNLFGSYSLKQDDRVRTIQNDRMQTDPKTGSVNNYHDYTLARARPFSNLATLGFDYTLDDKNNFGVSVNYYLRNMHKHDLVTKTVQSAENGNQDYDRKRENYERESSSGTAAYFEHLFNRPDRKLRLELNLDHKPEVEDNHYTNTYRFPNIPGQLDNTLIKQTADNRHANLGYETQIGKEGKFEAGYDGQFNKQDMDFYGAAFDPNKQMFVTDIAKTNHFIYNENVQALYSTFSTVYKKISLMLGLRGEYSTLDSRLITTGISVPNSYFKLYPSLHLGYKFAENKELQLNYSRRVRRPEADDLNPFPEYQDPTNVKVGNPYLLPEIIHSVELAYQWRKGGISVLPGIYYRYTYNRFTAITEALNDSVLVTRQQNLANDQAFGADVVVSGTVGDQLSLSFTPNIFYSTIDASNLGYSSKKSTITWSANLNATYAITKGTSLQVNSIYKSARLTPQGKYLPSFVMNCGARQDILNKKASVYITVSDIFRSIRQEAELQSPLLTQHILTKNNSRIVYLGLSYNFGVVKKRKDLQFDNSVQ